MNLVYDFIFSIGILISCIYILILWKSKTVSHKILVVLFIILILVVLESYAIAHQLHFLMIVTFIPASSATIGIGTLLYLYIQSLFYDDKIVLKKYWSASIPFFVFLIVYAIPALIAMVSRKYFLTHLDILQHKRHFINIISDIIFFTYIILSFNSLTKLKKVMKYHYSSFTHNNFIWVRYLLIAAVIIIAIDLIVVCSTILFDFDMDKTEKITILFVVIAIVYAAHFGLNQSKVLTPYFLLEEEDPIKSKKTPSAFDQKEFELLEKTLKSFFEKEQPYLNTELTLGTLATGIKISDKKLSILLNQYMKTTFYDFVNEYRITAFKHAIQSEESNRYTIESIAFQSGFKSKASFYRIFKKKMSISPSEYKKSIG